MLHFKLLITALLFSHLPSAFSQTFSSNILLVGSSFNSTRQGNVLVSINAGAYGAVCDTNWTLADATVVCRQLGYDVSTAGSVTAQTKSAYGAISTQASMTLVTCFGNEVDLAQCPFVSTTANPQYQCSSANLAGVTCFGAYIGTSNTSSLSTVLTCSGTNRVQLVNGTSGSPTNATNGRLQVSQDGVNWGTVCAQSFTQINAQVVCSSLCNGVSAYALAYPGSYYGQGLPLRVVLSNVTCTGSESGILNCPSNGFNTSTTCTDAVGINCAGLASQLPTGVLTCATASMQVSFSSSSNPLIVSINPVNASACQSNSSWVFNVGTSAYVVTVPYFDCGTTRVTVNDASGMPTYYQYNSVLVISATSGAVVSRTNQYQMSIQCTVLRSSTPSNTIQTGVISLTNLQSSYNISIQAQIMFFSDPGYSNQISAPVMLPVNTPVYVEVTISQTAASLGYRIVVPTCVTSPYSNFSAPLYYLIQNGCILDSSTVQFTTNTAQLMQFMFSTFRFVGNYSSVYLQCTTLLCASNDNTGLCSGQCSSGAAVGRRKRSLSQVLQTFLANGPIYIDALNNNIGNLQSNATVNVLKNVQTSLIDRNIVYGAYPPVAGSGQVQSGNDSTTPTVAATAYTAGINGSRSWNLWPFNSASSIFLESSVLFVSSIIFLYCFCV